MGPRYSTRGEPPPVDGTFGGEGRPDYCGGEAYDVTPRCPPRYSGRYYRSYCCSSGSDWGVGAQGRLSVGASSGRDGGGGVGGGVYS